LTVELSILPWPAAIVDANSKLRECNALWKERFGSCDELPDDFPEAAETLHTLVAQTTNAGAVSTASSALFQVRAPGEIAPLRLRFTEMRAEGEDWLWLMIVEERADEELLPLARTDTGELRDAELRDAELAMDGVAMRLQARNWRAFFHEAAAGKALIGLHGETLEVNRALCQLLCRSEHELLGLYSRDIRHPDDTAIVSNHYRSILNGGPPVSGIEARYLHKDGHYVNCLIAISLIRDSREKPLYFASEVEDITSRRQAEARLREQTQQLERANIELIRSNTELERFAFVASHDLQEPLRKIRVFGDRLQMLTTNSLSNVAIEVKDNGIGFDQAYAESIFEIFARLHGRSQYSGTGIGLAICRRVAHEHGGDLRAFAEPAQGARFVVTLPM